MEFVPPLHFTSSQALEFSTQEPPSAEEPPILWLAVVWWQTASLNLVLQSFEWADDFIDKVLNK